MHDAPEDALLDGHVLSSTLLAIWDGAPASLPSWARWFVDFGDWIAQQRPGLNMHALAVITVPTREFAAALSAVGVSAAVYGTTSRIDARSHFDSLSGLPRNTPVRLRQGNRARTGRLIGTERRDGRDYLIVDLGDHVLSRPWQRCTDIEPMPEGAAVSSRRRQLAEAPDFSGAVLGTDPMAHASHSGLDCLIVGAKELLLAELTARSFAAATAPKPRGCLQDLLRAKELLPNPRYHFRSQLVSAYAEEITPEMRAYSPGAVVLDGAAAFLRWRDRLGGAPHITLLDRSARATEEAVATFLAERAMGGGALDMDGSPAIAAAIELAAVWVPDP
jgi:hypothetical protein